MDLKGDILEFEKSTFIVYLAVRSQRIIVQLYASLVKFIDMDIWS